MRQKGIVDVVIIFIAIAALVAGGTMAVIHLFSDDAEQLTLSTSFTKDGAAFTYTADHEHKQISIGDINLYLSNPVFTCSASDEWARFPNPRPDCWYLPLNVNGKQYNLYEGQESQLTSHITVEPEFKKAWLKNVRGTYLLDDPDDWEVKLRFSVSGHDMDPSLKLPKDTFELNEDADGILRLNNPVATFDSDSAGVWYKTEHGFLVRSETWEKKHTDIQKGTNSYTIPLDTSEVGDVTLKVQPFATIQADSTVTLIEPEPVSVNYKVVQSTGEDSEQMSVIGRFKSFFVNLFNFQGWFN